MSAIGLATSGPIWGIYIHVRNNGKRHRFLLHHESGEIHTPETLYCTRMKALCVTVITPLVTLTRVVYYLAKTIFCLLKADIRGAEKSLEMGVKSFAYGFHLTFAGLKTVIRGKDGKRFYAELERDLNEETVSKLYTKKQFYLARCFQPITTLQEAKKTISIKLERHLNFLQKPCHKKLGC